MPCRGGCMEKEEQKNDEQAVAIAKAATSANIVTADSVEAEEVPTIPLGSLQKLGGLQPAVVVHSIASTHQVDMPTPLVVQSVEYQRSMREWLQFWRDGIRPAYLPLAVMPVLLGSVLAWTHSVSVQKPLGQFRFIHFIAMLAIACLLQAGASLINDYYDYLGGVDTANALGPGALIQQGLVKPARVLSVGLALLGSGALLGLIVAASGGAIVYVLGLVGLLCAYFYSATTRPLSAIALGELIGFLIYGPCMTLGAYAVETGTISHEALIYSVPLGLLAAGVIHLNNIRDIEGDIQSGRRTMASLLGLNWSRAWCATLLLAAYLVIIGLAMPPGAPHLILIILWTLPTLVVIITGVLRTDSPASFHLAMHKLLKMEVVFVVLLTIALTITTLLPVLIYLPTHILR
ncbi:MAG: hypothetical protein E6J34_11795 [Chloroflexi bacterium]|nr:MAG: hypothetical protein E6J34_11795 [Chloroflexota bacterium]